MSAKTLVNNAVSLRHMFEALAPDKDWTWLLPMIHKLKTMMVVTKNHSDLPRSASCSSWDCTSCATPTARTARRSTAIMFRNGLMIATLAARPMMRRENLARIKIGQNLIREGAATSCGFPTSR